MTEPTPSSIPRWVLPVMGAICCLVLIVALGLGLKTLRDTGMLENKPSPARTTVNGTAVREQVDASSLPYEEALDAPLEEGVKKIDYALLQALGGLALNQDSIELAEIELRSAGSQEYHFQRIRLSGAPNEDIANAIATSLAIWAQNATLTKSTESTYSISVHGVTTHELALAQETSLQGPEPTTPQPAPDSAVPPSDEYGTTPAPGPAPDPHQTPKGSGRLAIVIDDLGESVSAARKLVALSYPVTFAIWPRATHTRQVAELGAKHGEEIIIHQPMEPEGYPEVRPGPGTVFVQMTPDQIHTVIADNLTKVPEAVGINNHMGSRFTQNRAAVQAAMEELRKHNLFVLDSWTHSKSKLFAEARNAGLRAYKRSVFIDVIRDVSSIVHQLEKAERIALTTGEAIAIGHPLPETLAALKQWEAKRNKAVTVVTVGSLSPK
ncbi:divergent polysaccharide deacetylase family protein [Desulfovibrio mangrovi]|uniref:divergent polysaccharide deacetylase family protein n=1 Tax=Desulfovibrio mangrovi TaxID=2976983 RepID=UPI002248729E|nr:divergent polysaccharide deacetylase family protein [Desulfovibrio mangrovi]UZP67406.1 divergent polysaccharide deacetylase family protein [Desulfovibrio mangrovi]